MNWRQPVPWITNGWRLGRQLDDELMWHPFRWKFLRIDVKRYDILMLDKCQITNWTVKQASKQLQNQKNNLDKRPFKQYPIRLKYYKANGHYSLSIELVWILRHMDIHGNEITDCGSQGRRWEPRKPLHRPQQTKTPTYSNNYQWNRHKHGYWINMQRRIVKAMARRQHHSQTPQNHLQKTQHRFWSLHNFLNPCLLSNQRYLV